MEHLLLASIIAGILSLIAYFILHVIFDNNKNKSARKSQIIAVITGILGIIVGVLFIVSAFVQIAYLFCLFF